MASMVMFLLFVFINLDISSSLTVTSTCWERQQREQRVTTCRGPLPQFPPETKIIEMLIDQCQFDVLPNSTFVNIVQLTTLKVNCGRHVEFQSGWSLPVSDLISLDLNYNLFSSLPNGSFCNMNNLDMLQLDSNVIERPETLGFGDDDGQCKVSPVLRQLSMKNNRIRSLPDGAFSQLQQLKILQLDTNLIESIHLMAFRNLTSLYFLDLSNNRLSHIGDAIFHTILQLQSLYLKFNSLNDSIYDAIRPLVKLEVLYFNDNKVQTLDKKTMLKFPEMQSLMLSNNLISSIPPYCFSNMTKSLLLDIGSNNLRNAKLESSHFAGSNNIINLWLPNASISAIAPDAFTNLKTIAVLRLGENNIKMMPNVTGLTNLSFLNVSHNQIEVIQDDDLSDMTTVFELDISYNKIKHISKLSLRSFTYMMLLNLSNNQIESIEPGAFNSYTIREVRLDNNKLKSISGVFAPGTMLETLNLSTNHLTSFSYFDFPSNLIELQLDNNRIVTIEAKDVPPQTNLQIIDLSNNHLTSLKQMQVPSSFTILYLDNNNISTMDTRVFGGANNWRYLSLRNNSLQKLCRASLPPFQHNDFYRQALFISGNPFRCTCELTWVLGVLGHSHIENSPLIPDLDQTNCMGEAPILQTLILSTVRENFFKDRFWCKSGVGTVSDVNSCHCFENLNTVWCNLKCPKNCTCYHRDDWSAVVTRCQNAGLFKIPEDAAKETTNMVIDGNNIKMLKAHEFSSFRDLRNLYIVRSNLSSIQDFAFSDLSKLTLLDLAVNQLQTLSKDTFAGLSSLQILAINSNELKTIDENAFQPLETLIALHLHNNRLIQFPVWQLDLNTKLVSVMVHNNPWSCDCEFVEKFRKWLLGSSNSSLVVSVNNVTCQMSTDMSLIPMVSINDTVCLKMDNKTVFSVTVTIVSSIIGIFVPSIVIAFLIFYYRKEIQVLVYARYGIRMFRRGPQKDSNLNSDDKPFDIFVSYSSLDDDFLFEHILPGLETEVAVPYRLCIHQRDFAAGAFITDAILEAVARSKATLLLLSNNFMESEWCRFEFKAAHLQMLKDPQSKVVVVLLQPKLPKNIDPEIKLYLKTNTYLCWGDKLFWKRLYFTLPKPSQTQTDAI